MNFAKPEALLDLMNDDPAARQVVEQAERNALQPRYDVTTMEQAPTTHEIAVFKNDLRSSPVVRNLTSEIDINDPQTIYRFGGKAGDSINAISNQLLSNTGAIKATEVAEMMTNLTTVMKQFDVKEFDIDALAGKKGFFKKVKERTKASIEDLQNKADTMAKTVDKIASQLNRYEHEIDQSNINLARMYEANQQSFQLLEYYVVAADIGLEEIEAEKRNVEQNPAIPNDQKTFYIRKLEDNYNLLEQRKSDLMTVEAVSLQMLPTLAMMMQANYQLLGKINTSFIITLPIFKMGLVMAVMAERQKIQAQAISQLEDATNEMYLRNAQRVSDNAQTIAKMSNTNPIKIESIAKAQQIILQGVDEVKKTMETASAQRKENMGKLNTLIDDMKQQGFV